MVSQTSVLEISKSALQKNLSFIRKVIGKKPVLSCVVKGNAYGHDIKTYIPLAEECGINHFSVFSDYEAAQVLKASNKKSTIMIMGMIDPQNMTWVIKNGIEFFVFDIDRVQKAIQIAKKFKTKAHIHLELETGMYRTGLDQEQLKILIPILHENSEYIEIEGVCTHFAGAESISNYYRIMKQVKQFQKICSWLETQDIHAKRKHAACSAAIINFPKTRLDLVRVGVMQYGFWPTEETFINYITKRQNKKNPLVPVLSWKSTVMSVKNVPAGQYVGYGDSFLANEDMKIAIVPVGYTNGYSRMLSNTSSILVHGKRVGVIGSVNMNLLIINVSQIPDIKKGDEVVLVGSQEDQRISFASFREQKNALNYEVLARLPENIQRKITE
ncbi:alanine racemase [Candidatus Gracilibacteria bacterium]|nr:alanine racemase [Candidatus Gracilibacteria bacterium]